MRSTPWPKLTFRTVMVSPMPAFLRAIDGAFEGLQTLLVAFSDLDVDADGITRPKFRMLRRAFVLADELGKKCVLHGQFCLNCGRRSDRVEAAVFSRVRQPGATA